MKKSNYDLVLEIVWSFEDDDVENDFKERFKEGENISKEEFFKFFEGYEDDMSEVYYIKKNWEYVESGGDESVYDEEDEDDDWDEDDE